LAQVRQHGILLEEATTGERTFHRVLAQERLAPDADYDLVLVALRKSQLSEALPMLAYNWRAPTMLFLGSNVAGPDALMDAVGRQRVLLGFPGVAGHLDRHVVRYVASSRGRVWPAVIGEPDGSLSERLDAVSALLGSAGIPVELSVQIDAWLKSHAALVLPLAMGLYMSGGELRRMVRTPDALVLAARGIREGLGALADLGIPIVPARLRLLCWIPEPLMISRMRKRLGAERAEIGLQAHALAARDEIAQLASEFTQLVRGAGRPTPAWDRLCEHLDVRAAALRLGQSEVPLDWTSTLGAVTLLLFVSASTSLLRSRARRRRRRRGAQD
jgi:2-dehydropantoate 2-reductase